MARRNSPRNTESTSTTTEENTMSNITEEQVAPEQVTDQAPTESTGPDLTEFQSVVAEALDAADTSTGEVPAEPLAKAAESYRALDKDGKTAARKWVEEQMREGITNLNILAVRGYSMVNDNLKASASKSASKASADPSVAYGQRLVALRLALSIAESDVPEGVDVTEVGQRVADEVTRLSAEVDQFRTWEADTSEDKGEAPEVSPQVKAAFKLAAGRAAGRASGGSRSGGGSTGPKGSIAVHLAEAFADKEPGDFMKISEIAKFESSQYPNGSASQGAISARLFPESGKCTVEGIEPVPAGNGQPRGARKV